MRGGDIAVPQHHHAPVARFIARVICYNGCGIPESQAVRMAFERRFWLLALVVMSFCALPLVRSGATAQQPAPPPASGEPLLGSFYKDPRPERLIGFLDRVAVSPALQNRNAYPLIAGFYAAVFRSHPDDIEKLVPRSLDAKTAETIAAALRLSGNRAMYQRFEPRLAATGRDLDIAVMFVNLPSRLEQVEITSSTALNILWGAAFASGDPTFVRMILDYFARTANLDDAIGLDIVGAVTGQPRDVPQMQRQYGVLGARQIMSVTEALVTLQMNAQRHAFVNGVVAKYIAEHPGTTAQKVLTATRPRQP